MSLADALSVARALAALPIVWAISRGDTPVAFVVFALAALTDAVDGPVARRAGSFGHRGAFLDPLADKILVLATLVAMASAGIVSWILVALIVTRELFVLVLRVRAYSRGLQIHADITAKAKTACEMVGIGVLIAAPAPFSAIGIALLIAALAIGLATLPRHFPARVRRLA